MERGAEVQAGVCLDPSLGLGSARARPFEGVQRCCRPHLLTLHGQGAWNEWQDRRLGVAGAGRAWERCWPLRAPAERGWCRHPECTWPPQATQRPGAQKCRSQRRAASLRAQAPGLLQTQPGRAEACGGCYETPSESPCAPEPNLSPPVATAWRVQSPDHSVALPELQRMTPRRGAFRKVEGRQRIARK